MRLQPTSGAKPADMPAYGAKPTIARAHRHHMFRVFRMFCHICLFYAILQPASGAKPTIACKTLWPASGAKLVDLPASGVKPTIIAWMDSI